MVTKLLLALQERLDDRGVGFGSVGDSCDQVVELELRGSGIQQSAQWRGDAKTFVVANIPFSEKAPMKDDVIILLAECRRNGQVHFLGICHAEAMD